MRSLGSVVDCDLWWRANQTTTSMRNREDAKNTGRNIRGHENTNKLEAEGETLLILSLKGRNEAYLDVEVFGVVEHGFECFGLEGHVDFDFLDLARFGGFYLGEGCTQYCLGSVECCGRQRTLGGRRHQDYRRWIPSIVC